MLLFLKGVELIFEGVGLLYCGKNILAGKLVPVGSHYRRVGINLAEKRYAGKYLIVPSAPGVGKHDGGRSLYLIVIELAEILHIHLAFIDVGNRGVGIEHRIIPAKSFNRADNVGELTDARRLDENPVGLIFVKHLRESCRKIADERAADAARVHLCDLNARILQESAVNAYLAKFIFYKHKLLARVSLLNKLFYKRGLTRAEKSRKNINLRHNYTIPKRKPPKNIFLHNNYITKPLCCQVMSYTIPLNILIFL